MFRKIKFKIKNLKYKIFGILCIFIFCSAMIPINATDTLTGTDIIKKTLEERIVEPINGSEVNETQPLEQYFLNKKSNQSIFMITKFIEDFDRQQTVLPANISTYEFMNAYMANDTSKTFEILGMNFTAERAVKNIPILKDYPATMFRFIDYYVTLNEREQIDYVWRNYPQFESIEKNLEHYSNDKLSYVLEHAQLNCTDLIDKVPKSKVALSKWDAYKQYAYDTLGAYGRAIQNEGIYYDLYIAPQENPIMDLSRILDVITNLNGTLHELDDTRYETAQGSYAMQAVGGFLIALGTVMIVGSAIKDFKTARAPIAEAANPAPVQNTEVKTVHVTDVDGNPLQPVTRGDIRLTRSRIAQGSLNGVDLNTVEGLTTIQKAEIMVDAVKYGDMEPFVNSADDTVTYARVGRTVIIDGKLMRIVFRIEIVHFENGLTGYKFYDNTAGISSGLFFEVTRPETDFIRFNGYFGRAIIGAPPSSPLTGNPNLFDSHPTESVYDAFSTPLGNLTNNTIFKNLDDDGLVKFYTVNSDNNISYDVFGVSKTDVENNKVYSLTGLNESSIVSVYGFNNQSQPILEGFIPKSLPVWAEITKDVGIAVGSVTLLIIIGKYIPWGNHVIYLIGSIILAIGIVIEVLGCYMSKCANVLSETITLIANAFNRFVSMYNFLIYEYPI